MLSLMTFKYYFVALLLSLFSQTLTFKLQRKHILFAVNLFVVSLVYFVAKKHFIFLIAHVSGGYLICRMLQESKERKFLPFLSLLYVFLPLIFFKYTYPQNLIIKQLPYALTLLRPAVFLGISFYTFRLSSVVIDILYGRIKEKVCPFNLFTFSLFFPCLLSGPLDRYSRFVTDVENSVSLSWKNQYHAIYRIALGVFKKIVIADILWNFSNDSYNSIELYQLPTSKVILGQYAYYLLLYFDFSGYSDIAIGVSNLFGINTPENFQSPWKARNIQIFWNSWHISFMHWLRDYIFYPLQTFLLRIGVSNIPVNNSISYFSIFIIAGLWHGEQSHFLYYGLFHGFGFVIFFTYKRVFEKLLTKEQRKSYLKNKFIELASIIITFHFFVISLFFFIDKNEIFSIAFNRVFSP
ncbi:MAG: MBOAT family O-acyltransferase [Bacteriovorax sp.]|jgi:membrane protein involved in D-alanine export